MADLTDQQAIVAANFVVGEWMKVSGAEALALWQTIDRVSKSEGPIEEWALDPKVKDRRTAKLCRQMLDAFASSPPGKGADFRKWTRQGIDAAKEAHAQVFDPASAAVVGTVVIGLVLAARVQSIGKDRITFYKGLPSNLGKVVKLVASSMGVPS
jgi:hypothetical protein